ncbi:protein containing Methyltransferase type 11 domain [Candidatus Vecturithrix granuli]|uniref:Arsenite methyltransferase n=1 Tax=Vecturithrix granuli TaxID=1499967 RepID=A0A081BZI6_VECG1|nr:protein containing Methyltransferase type 11 domain [Candidatus Vecturithrix granuli]
MYKVATTETRMQTAEQIKTIVKEKYGQIASQRTTGCCGPQNAQVTSSCCGSNTDAQVLTPDYSQVDGYYAGADLGLGCGVPTQFADIQAGEVVLDLGSGAGNDVFVVRSLVGESGKVIGVDMTAEMIARAQENQAKLGYQNVEFRLGEIESLPVKTGEVDVVISNCVLNLVPDKTKAFQEIYRVLKPGGHFCISDIVLRGELPEKLKSLAELYAGCVAGALQHDEYLHVIREAGFTDMEIHKDHQYILPDAILTQYLSHEDIELYRHSNTGIFSITVSARKPATAE